MATALCVLICLFICVQRLGSVRTLRKLTVQRGGSATVPCHYEEKYRAQVKYWCRGYTWNTCRVLIRSDGQSGPSDTQLSMRDDVSQRVFTVTMTNLQDTDSDVYWCAVDVTGSDDKAYLNIVVIAGPPELYSERSVFSGLPGGQVQVRCLYSGRLRGSEKKWCRSGTSVCLTAGRSSRLHKYTLTFDPETGTLSVTIRHLSPKDSGWYWCTGGDTQLPVYVSVSLETHTPPVTQPMITTWTSEAPSTLKATSQSEGSRQKTPSVQLDESMQTTLGAVQSQEDNSEHSVQKIPSMEILFKVPLAVVYLICLAVAITKYCEMTRWKDTRGRNGNV